MYEGNGATSFDYVIVGAGSAGCVIAARLSADPSVSVLLVEAGPPDDAPGMDVPILAPAGFTEDAILRYARETAMTTHHPCGTCGIGSVVDAELRVLGVDSLRVADASVFPRITRANTNAAAIMVGEKAADLLKLGKGCLASMSVNLDNIDPGWWRSTPWTSCR